QYVMMTKEDFEEVDPLKSRAIEIHDFVDLDQIDPIYFDHPYYLGPDKGAEKAYALLTKAMNEQGKVAIARFVLRNKENLAAIRPMGNVLTMATMRFADEVVSTDEIAEVLDEVANEKPRKAEVDMAKQLIDSLSGEFDPAAYEDQYRQKLMALIERKSKGEVIEVESEAPKPTRAPDLMAALEESLAAVKSEPLASGSTKAKAKSPAKKSSAKKPAAAKKSRAKSATK
ncbi:MAG: Ku protein, partial [Actinomycetota bacterium]|nr:Ku protein [Actinomycetota bacterium]